MAAGYGGYRNGSWCPPPRICDAWGNAHGDGQLDVCVDCHFSIEIRRGVAPQSNGIFFDELARQLKICHDGSCDVVIRGGHFRAAALDNVRNSKRLHTACTPPGTRCGIDRCDATFAAASRWRV